MPMPAPPSNLSLERAVMGCALLGLLIALAAGAWRDSSNPRVCVDSATVVSIVAVQPHQATVAFDDGRVQTLNLPRLKAGDFYCFKKERPPK